MFSSKAGWGYAPPAVLFAVLFTSCIRQPAGAPAERLAILRLENLSGDPSLDWAGRALSEIIAGELSGAGKPRVISSANIHALDRVLGVRPISAPGISAESSQALAAGATLLAYGDYTVRNGKLEVQLTIEDARAHQGHQGDRRVRSGRRRARRGHCARPPDLQQDRALTARAIRRRWKRT